MHQLRLRDRKPKHPPVLIEIPVRDPIKMSIGPRSPDVDPVHDHLARETDRVVLSRRERNRIVVVRVADAVGPVVERDACDELAEGGGADGERCVGGEVIERGGRRGREEVVEGAASVVACPVVRPWVASVGGHVGAVSCAKGTGEGKRERELAGLEGGGGWFEGRCEDEGGGGEKEEDLRVHVEDWQKRYVGDTSVELFLLGFRYCSISLRRFF